MIKKQYDGNVDLIAPDFVALVSTYMGNVLKTATSHPKTIHGRPVTASELQTYIKVYVELFTQVSDDARVRQGLNYHD